MFSNIQITQEDNRFVFMRSETQAGLSGNGKSCIAWNKPPGIIGLNILCIGGGGSGGYASTVTVGTKAGAGGGASGSITSVSILSRFLPETLYVRVGRGGPSELASGQDSLVTIVAPDGNNYSPYYTVALAYGGAVGGSTTSVGEVRGLGGTATIAPTILDMPLASYGTYSMVNGKAGANGGQLSTGFSSLVLSNNILSGGAGGGSASSAGVLYAPGITKVNQDVFDSDTIRLPVISSSPSLVDGNGTTLFKPIFCSFGGSGGNASHTGNASAAGKGGIGCGGGGGASAETPFSAGAGGAGGDGLVIISCW